MSLACLIYACFGTEVVTHSLQTIPSLEPKANSLFPETMATGTEVQPRLPLGLHMSQRVSLNKKLTHTSWLPKTEHFLTRQEKELCCPCPTAWLCNPGPNNSPR